jgi:hypothetical protein
MGSQDHLAKSLACKCPANGADVGRADHGPAYRHLQWPIRCGSTDACANGPQLNCITFVTDFARENLAIDVSGSIGTCGVIEMLRQPTRASTGGLGTSASRWGGTALATSAKVVIEEWRRQYNDARSHSSLGQQPPAAFSKLRAVATKREANSQSWNGYRQSGRSAASHTFALISFK